VEEFPGKLVFRASLLIILEDRELETNLLNKLTDISETEKVALRKKILIFGFFLMVSVILWLVLTLSKNFDDQINYPVSYKNFPESKALIDDLPDHLTLNVSASGFTLLRYRLSSRYIPISFSVNSFKMNRLSNADSTSFYIETRLALEHISSQLSSEFVINKISPDTLIFRFARIASKKLPVKQAFTFQLDKQLILREPLKFYPDSVLASGPDFIIDTLQSIFTEATQVGKISKDCTREIKLNPVKYIYVREEIISAGFSIEQFTEKTLQVPVEIINIPRSIRMQAFPRFISLTCQVGLSNYEKLEASLFKAQVNYREIITEKANKLTVNLVKQPDFIQACRFTPKTVEYIIEK
jgi:hypothetical protein